MSATLNNTLGALEIGLVFSSMIYGMTCVQVYHYANGAKNDRPGIKWMVTALWVLETLHMALIIKWFYGVSVTDFGVPRSYADLTWTYCVAIMFHGLVGTLVQWFFSWRVWTVSGRAYLAAPSAFVSIFRCCLAFFIAIKFGTVGEKGFHEHYQWSFILAQALNTATDIWNAAALVIFLKSRRSAYKSTNDMLNRIMLFTLETGLVTAGLAFTLCITWAVMPYNEVWNGVLFVYTRANANAVLVALNSRRDSSNGDSRNGVSGVGSVNLSTISYTRGGDTMMNPTTKDGIYIQTQTDTVADKDFSM